MKNDSTGNISLVNHTDWEKVKAVVSLYCIMKAGIEWILDFDVQ